MNIEKVKLNIKNSVGKKYSFKFNGSRNQVEEFIGVIYKTYNYIFTIINISNNNQIKSFSYNDVLANNLEIHPI